MKLELYNKKTDLSTIGWALVIFKRLVAFFLIVFGLGYWAMIIGIWPGGELRFDTLPIHWQHTAPLLAVMLPVAALGLWGLFSWGTIAWLLTAIAELGLYLGKPELFGSNEKVVIFHSMTIATYICIKALSRIVGKKDQKTLPSQVTSTSTG